MDPGRRHAAARLLARPVVGVVVLLVAGLLAGAVVGAMTTGFTDLHAYRHGGRLLLDGLPLHETRDPASDLRFTYPPFAALVMTPLVILPGWLGAALWTGLSAAALAVSIVVVRTTYGHVTPGWVVVLVGAGALALEPVWQNLSFGQINLVLMVAVLADLTRGGPGTRWSGVLVGVAAGIKLTPLVFVVLLVLVGHRAAAARAAVAFAATVAVGFAVAPGSSASYWTDGLLDGSRVGPPALAHNQSAYGALTRLLDGPPGTVLWLVVAGALALGVLLVAAARWRRDDRLLATCLAAVAMLIASPVSWSHHWVWAVPVALALWEHGRIAAIAWVAVFVARPMLWPPWGGGREYDWGPVEHLVGNAYLLAGLALALTLGAAVPKWSRAPVRTGQTEP